MLTSLHIENLALIATLDIELGPGLNVLTGETGAGKSIILDALAMLLGARANKDMIRTGESLLVVEGLFRFAKESPVLAQLAARDIPYLDDGELMIRREVTSGGNRCRINGMAVPNAVLSEIGNLLVDIHGQHEHQSLLSAKFHRDCLDAFAHLEPLRSEVGRLYKEWKRIENELERLEELQRDRARQLDLLRYQVEEIEKADPQANEDALLEEEYNRLFHAERLRELLGQATELLADAEESVLSQLSTAQSRVSEASGYLESLEETASNLEGAQLEIQAAAEAIVNVLDGIEVDPDRLDAVIQRQESLKKLKKKYGATIGEVLEFRDSAQKQLEDLEQAEYRRDALEQQLIAAEGKLLIKSRELSDKRRAAATQMQQLVAGELAGLSMKGTALTIEFQDVVPGPATFSAAGHDQLEFLIAPNPGEAPKPLRKIASGGEMSRIMLALKSVLASVDTIPVLVFDEIDTGIGGAVGNALGEKLAALGVGHQVLCVTHLPQIARYAGRHFLVSKHVSEGRTESRLFELTRDARVQELARMMSGEVTDESLRHAEKLLVV